MTLTLYGISEGLESLQICGGEKPAGLLTSRGEVWFTSSKGPVRISIDQPKPSDRPPVLIDQVVADGLREQEVLRHLVGGMSNKEIANMLGITEVTVKCRVSTILMRLNVSDRTQAVVTALQRGLVHL